MSPGTPTKKSLNEEIMEEVTEKLTVKIPVKSLRCTQEILRHQNN
jgi:hypothetical protein